MKKKITTKLIIRVLAAGAACLIFWSWYQARSPELRLKGSVAQEQKKEVNVAVPTTVAESFSLPTLVVAPKARHVVVQPAGFVKVPEITGSAPDAVKDFRNWAKGYFAADPTARAGLIEKGKELAGLHRAAIKQTISNDPKLALELAVPMVVRQDLPDEVEQQLENRINTRGNLMVRAAVPLVEGDTVQSIQHLFQPDGAQLGEYYEAHVYGDRSRMRSLTGTRVSGVEVDRQLAVLDSTLRQLEVGERPDPAKPTVEACPISGIITPAPKSADATPAPVAANVTVVEDNKRVYILCASGHIGSFADRLNQEESDAHRTDGLKLAEGSTGGGSTPFDVPPGWTNGTKTLLYLRVAFPDNLRAVSTEKSVYDNLKQATDFFQSNSFGRFYLTPSVAPLVVLPYPRAWYNAARVGGINVGDDLLRGHALEVARRMGYDPTSYDLDVVEYDSNGPGSFGGLGYVGARGVWLKTSSVGTLIHELGHNLGLWHANRWQTSPPTINGPGNNDEYGNKFDVMGTSGAGGDFVAVHKTILNWLTPDSVHQVTASGTYRIYQVDQGRSDADKRYALAVNMDSERNYWFEFRQKFPTINSLNDGLLVTWNAWGAGASLKDDEAFASNRGTHLLDMTPGSGTFEDTRDDAGLMIGRTFSDEAVGVHVTPVFKSKIVKPVTSASEIPYMDVVVNRGFYPGNHPPSLSITVDNLFIPLGGTALFTASGSDLDRDTLAYSWDFGDKTFSTDNARIQKKQFLKLDANGRPSLDAAGNPQAIAGKFQVLCTATDMKGGRTTRSILVTVGAETLPDFDYTISGRILDNSFPVRKPVEGVYISNRALTVGATQNNSFGFRSTYTDSNGYYNLTNVPANAGNTQTTIIASKWPDTFSIDTTNVFTVTGDKDDVNWTEIGLVPHVTVEVEVASVTEGAGYGVIKLTRSDTSGILNVQMLENSQGTAERILDYTLTNDAAPNPSLPSQVTNANNRDELKGALGVSFAAGVGVVRVRVNALADSESEGTEYAVVDFPDTAYAYPGTDRPRTIPYHVTGARKAVVAIIDQDSSLPVVTLTADDQNMIESTPATRDTARLRVRREGPVDNPLTVTLAYSGTANLADDFNLVTPDPLSIEIPVGLSEITVNVLAVDDLVGEGLEVATVSLSPSLSYNVNSSRLNSVDLYIADNDQPVVQVTAPVATTGEGSASPGRFLISRSSLDISDDLVVNFSLGGSALSGSDYKRVSGIAVIPANELTVDILIESIQDSINEDKQTVILKIAADPNYAIGAASTATVTIIDNDPFQFSIQSLLSTVTEPASNTASVRCFRVFRPFAPTIVSTDPLAPPPVPSPSVTVNYRIASSSTARPSTPGSVGVPAAANDFAALYNPSAVAPAVPNGQLVFLGTEAFKDITIVINSDNENVAPNDDIFSTSNEYEDAETLTLELLPGTGYQLGFESEATTVILDADRPMIDVSYADFSSVLSGPVPPPALINLNETSTGIQFYFSRTGDTSAARIVDFSFGGSASYGALVTTPGADFTASNGSQITIPAGASGAYLTITLINDSIAEGTETLTVNVSPAASLGAYGSRFGSSTIYIDDNDLYTGSPAPEVSFELASSSVAERTKNTAGVFVATTHTINISLNAVQASPVSVNYRLAGGSATGRGVDYTFTPRADGDPMVFEPGETTKQFTFTTTPDLVPEGDETILFDLIHASGANLGTQRRHTVTLKDTALPEVLTDSVANRPNTTADLRGRVLPNNGTTTAWFEWGTSPSALSNRVNIPGQLSGVAFTPIAATITGLTYPGTYYYRAVATNEQGTSRGIVRTIRTLAAPTVVTTTDAGHTASSVTVAGTINPNRGVVDFYFEWGPTDALGNTTPEQSLTNGIKPVIVTAPITGLAEGASVFYRLVAVSRSGLGTVRGDIKYSTAIPYLAAGDLIVNIQANQPSAGSTAWANLGLPFGTFTTATAAPLVTNVHGTGIPGVFFDGKTTAYELAIPTPLAPVAPWTTVIGADSRTIEVWAYNPGYGTPDTLVNMGRDGAESQLAINHSNLTQTESALSHGTKNADFTAKTLPLLARWNHFAYVYESTKKTATLYVNGVKNTTVPALTLATSSDPITVGASRNSGGTLEKYLQGYINSLRIHDGILTPQQILTNFNLGPVNNAPAAPVVLSTGISALTPTSVTLNGLVGTSGNASTAWIEWGTSTQYDNASAPIAVAVSTSPTPITLALANLVPGVEYHYRIVARNARGLSVGNDVAFTPQVLASNGKLWVDLRAQDFTGASPWTNTAGLGDFDVLGTPTVNLNVLGTGYAGVEFDGSSDAFESSAMADIDFSYGDDQTTEVWVLNPSIDQANETIVHQGRVTTPASRLRLSYGTAGGADDSTASNLWTTAAPVSGQWTHLAVVVSAGTRSLFVDGAQVGATTTHPAGVNQWADKVLLGAARDSAGVPVFGTEGFSGFINSVKIHGGAMLPAQLKASYEAGPSRDAAAPGLAPVVVTSATPTLVSNLSATLGGTVQAGGLPTNYWFEWGTSAAFGNRTPPTALPNTFALQPVSAPIGGWTGAQTIHYRLVAQNAQSPVGGTLGATFTFSTGAALPGLPSAVTNAATLITAGKATLNGLATPSTAAATAWFEYGPTTSMTLRSPKVTIPVNVPRSMTFAAAGLLPHTLYSFRMVVENANGLVVGGTLTFTSFNSIPTVSAVTVKAIENVATPLLLKGLDADKEALTFAISSPPTKGVISGVSPNFFYTSTGNLSGTDTFSYTATDGAVTSGVATVTVTITPVNDAPIGTNITFLGLLGTPLSDFLVGIDEESDPITYFISRQPRSGAIVLDATTGAFTYTPDVGSYAADSFEYRVVAGGQTSTPAVINLIQEALAPTALATNLFTAKNTNLNGQVLAKGPAMTTLTFTKETDPNVAHGSITAFNTTDGTFTFVPFNNYVGTATFTFTVTGGVTTSTAATVTIVVGGPEADSLEFSGVEDDQVAGTLTATDPNALPLTYSLVATANAKNGVVDINADGSFTYNPKAGFVGVDRFDFQATNNTLVSNPGTVIITITKRPPNWVWIQGANVPKQLGVYGAQGIPASANAPGARADFASWAEADGTLWIFGGLGFGEGKTAGALNDLWKRNATTGEWTWVAGSKLINTKGNYGAQGLSAASNQPGARSGAASWLGQDGKLWMLGGNGFDAVGAKSGNLNDLWVYDPGTSEWTWMKGALTTNVNGTYGVKGASASTNTPGARQGASTWTDVENVLWLFGGIGQPGTGVLSGSLADLWKFNPATNNWTWVSGSSAINDNGVYGALEEISSTTLPGARSYASSWKDKDGVFYLFGGNGFGATGKTVGFLNDVWAYYPESNRWAWIKGNIIVGPPSVSGILGVTNPLNNPSGRAGSVTWNPGSEQAWIFGGQGKSGHTNDVWRFDLASKQWALIKGSAAANGLGVYGSRGTGLSTTTPGARRGSAAYADAGGDLWLIGGANGANNFNDLWKLDQLDSVEVTTLAATSITDTTATLNAEFLNKENVGAVSFRYWPLGNLSEEESSDWILLGPAMTEALITENLTGLNAGTSYAFQSVGEVNGTLIYGETRLFTTSGSAPGVEINFDQVADDTLEGGADYFVQIRLSAPSTALITVPLAVTVPGPLDFSGIAILDEDYKAVTSVAVFPPGQTSVVVRLPLINDAFNEPDELLTITADTPTGPATLGTDTEFVLTIKDDDEVPFVVTPPASTFAIVGEEVSLTVGATGSRLTFQWKRNNVVIPKATTSNYKFIASLATAGIYTCAVSNDLDFTETRADVFVLETKAVSVILAAGTPFSFSVKAASSNGRALTYRWRDAALAPTSLISGNGVSGASTNTLSFTGTSVGNPNVQPVNSRSYICRVSAAGNPNFFRDSAVHVLSVPDERPIITSLTLPDGVVNTFYSFQLQMDPAPRKQASKFEATNLPRGLTINPKTGLISGKPTVATGSGGQTVTITASNSLVNSHVVTRTLVIQPLPTTIQGTYVALLERAPATANMGARVDLAITSAGLYTLKLTMSGLTSSASGILTPEFIPTNTLSLVRGEAVIKRKVGQSNLTLQFTVSTAGVLDFVLTDPDVAPALTTANETVNVRQTYVGLPIDAVTNAPKTGDYTMILDLKEPQLGDLEIPQGNGYATMKLTPDGKITGVGRTSEGNTFTIATILGPTADRSIPIFASFTPVIGSLMGAPIVDAQGYLSGEMTWNKGPALATAKVPFYRSGFEPISLTAMGGKYEAPAAGTVVRGLPNVANNAMMRFSEGGLLQSELDTLVFSIRNPSPTGKAQVSSFPAPNLNKLSFAAPASPAGSFSGKVTIPNPVPALTRNLTFQGVMAKINPTDWMSAGYILVPQLPQPSQTLTTSTVYSGQVELVPAPVVP